MSDSTTPRFDTLAVHGGAAPDPTTGSRAVPIYQTVAYNFKDTDHAADLFGLRAFGNIYSRIMNPTNDVLEQRIAALDGGSAAVAVASGHAAEVLALLNVAGTGDNIVSSTSLYGGTWNIFLHTFRRLGIEVRFVETTDTARLRRRVRRHAPRPGSSRRSATRASTCPDLGGLAASRSRARHPARRRQHVRARRTCAGRSSTARRSSSSRSRSGSAGTARPSAASSSTAATSTGATGRIPLFTEPDASYHGLKFWDDVRRLPRPRQRRVRHPRSRQRCCATSARALSPFNAQQFLLGVETLSLRVQRHSDNALAVAKLPRGAPEGRVGRVPGPGEPPHAGQRETVPRERLRRRRRLRREGRPGGRQDAHQRREALQPPRQRRRREVAHHPPRLDDALAAVRRGARERRHRRRTSSALSVGIENIDDIIADLEQALERV